MSFLAMIRLLWMLTRGQPVSRLYRHKLDNTNPPNLPTIPGAVFGLKVASDFADGGINYTIVELLAALPYGPHTTVMWPVPGMHPNIPLDVPKGFFPLPTPCLPLSRHQFRAMRLFQRPPLRHDDLYWKRVLSSDLSVAVRSKQDSVRSK
jgi:hypothetical protein